MDRADKQDANRTQTGHETGREQEDRQLKNGLTKVDLKAILEGPSPSPLVIAASHLETAARILRECPAGRLDSAAWRAADALVYMADEAARHGWTDVPGIHEPTGLQAARTAHSGGVQPASTTPKGGSDPW